MFTKEEQVAGLEHQITGAKQVIAHSEEVSQLVQNPLFRKVILEQFCTRDCARYVQESGDPLLPEANRADALALAQAAGHLRRWLDLAIRMGDNEKARLFDLQSELDIVRSEPEDEE